ncbi:hypothetical protein CPB86DRAFT_775076 [Serendipita vermifera]|nr:hypothetical protein CPB86DRAFT_775076 [Serendipita vermifera]
MFRLHLRPNHFDLATMASSSVPNLVQPSLTVATRRRRYLQVDPTIDLTILESEDTLGGTWAASGIYPELLTMQPYGHYETSDMSYEPSDDPPQPGNFIPSRRFGTTVLRCQRANDGAKWEVHIKRKDQEREEVLVCDKLIVATGQTSLPHTPNIPSDNFTPLTIHSRYLGAHYDYLQSEDVHTVCVYGGGNAEGDGGMGAFFTPEFIGNNAADAAFTPMTTLFQPNIFETASWGHRFFHSGRNWFGSWLIWRTLRKWNYEAHEQMMKLKPEVYDHNFFWNVRIPFVVPDQTIMNLIRAGKQIIVHRAGITKLSGKEVHLSDGTSVETDMLIHATGYNTHDPIFSEKDSFELGLSVRIDHLASLDNNAQYPTSQSVKADEEVTREFPRLRDPPVTPRAPTYTQYRLYRFMVPFPLLKSNDRSLAFVGFLTGVAMTILTEVSALWTVAWLSGQLEVKRKEEEMEWEMDLVNAYIKRRYIGTGRQDPVLNFEWFSFVKILLSDLNVPLLQKSTLKPWLPADYRGLVERWKVLRSCQEQSQ